MEYSVKYKADKKIRNQIMEMCEDMNKLYPNKNITEEEIFQSVMNVAYPIRIKQNIQWYRKIIDMTLDRKIHEDKYMYVVVDMATDDEKAIFKTHEDAAMYVGLYKMVGINLKIKELKDA